MRSWRFKWTSEHNTVGRLAALLAYSLALVISSSCGQLASPETALRLAHPVGLGPAEHADQGAVLVVFDGRSMPTRIGCGSSEAASDAYVQKCNGYLETTLDFPRDGLYQFDVEAYGSRLGGVGPRLELRLDQLRAGSAEVASSAMEVYTFFVAVKAGSHAIGLVFANDAQSSSEDRNLYLGRTTVKTTVVPLLDSSARQMPERKGCGEVLADGYYAQLCEGSVATRLSFPSDELYSFAVNAYGAWALGAWPELAVLIDGQLVAQVKVDSADAATYLVQAPISRGEHQLELRFVNDAWSGSAAHDRNLFLGNLAVFVGGSQAKPARYRLVWSDEFSGDRLDPNNWAHEVNGHGGGNNELQYYTARPENSYVSQGSLVIAAKREEYEGKAYTSARVTARKRFDFTYGRVEVAARLPLGRGIWPAIWMMPTESVYGGWPRSGEIDIMELLGHEPHRIYGTLHFGDAWPANQNTGGSFVLPNGDFSQAYHVFAVEWEPGLIQWSVDGQVFSSKRPSDLGFCHKGGRCPWRFDQTFYVILNLAVGGNWPGNPDQTTRFPQLMQLDYVRIYQRA